MTVNFFMIKRRSFVIIKRWPTFGAILSSKGKPGMFYHKTLTDLVQLKATTAWAQACLILSMPDPKHAWTQACLILSMLQYAILGRYIVIKHDK